MYKKPFKNLKLKHPILTKAVIERMHLFKKVYNGRITASEAARLSFLIGMINENQYDDYLRIEKEYSLFE